MVSREPPSSPPALVDDVATSGGSLLRAAEAVREEMEIEPRLALVIVDREEGARQTLSEAGIELLALFGRGEILRNQE